MKIEYWCYSNVQPDGSFEHDPRHLQGSVDPKAKCGTSGLHHAQTASAVRDDRWLCVSTGRLDDGTMHGITLYFDDETEFRAFQQHRKATGQVTTGCDL